MKKKIAIIYTGETRTIQKTIEYFKKNVLFDDNQHVFAVLQSDTIEFFDSFLKKNIGDNLKSIYWLDKNDKTWSEIKENLISKMYIPQDWKEYLGKKSGSMIEYYQMYLAYKAIEETENLFGYKYDYIMRIRCDVILTHPIYFDWDLFTIHDVKEILYQIKELRNFQSIVCYDVVNIFFNSLYYRNRIYCKDITYNNYHLSESFNKLLTIENEDNLIKKIHDYLLEGKYILTLRKNQIYITKRCNFTNISTLGVTYGSHIMKEYIL